MAEQRKASQRATTAAEDSPQSGESAKAGDRSRSPAKPPNRRVTKRYGGHTVTVNPPAKTTVVGRCSVHGIALVDGKCPEPHESRGWRVKEG